MGSRMWADKPQPTAHFLPYGIHKSMRTGTLDQGFRMDGRTRFSYDFSRGKYPKLKAFKYRLNYRLDYHGAETRFNRTLVGDDVQI